jgi:hypothetical protein
LIFTFCGRNSKIIMRWPYHVKIGNQPRLNGKLGHSTSRHAGDITGRY